MIGRKLRSSRPLGGSIAVASGLPSSSRKVRNSGISRWTCAFSPISCSKDTFEIGWNDWTAFSRSLRKYFSTAWCMVSDSASASPSVSMRNQVLPPGASHTYLMLPPDSEPGAPASRMAGCDVVEAKSRRGGLSTATSAAALPGARLPRLALNPPRPARAQGRRAARRAPQRRRLLRRLGPFAPQRDQGGHHRRPDEEAEDAKALQPAEDAQQHPQERQPHRSADQHGPHEMVGDEDDDAAGDDDHDAADRVAGGEQVERAQAIRDRGGEGDD